MKIQQNCEWLFIFYIQEDNMLGNFTSDLYTTICETGNSTAHAIWIIRQNIIREPGGTGHFNVDLLTFEENGDPHTLKEFPLSIIGTQAEDENAWIASLRYILTAVKHDRKAIFTWSHGCGFGINVVDTRNLRLAKWNASWPVGNSNVKGTIADITPDYILLNERQFEEISSNGLSFLIENDNLELIRNKKKLRKNEFYVVEKYASIDCEKLQLLWMADYARELSALGLDKPFDLMIMINCCMQLFENGYMLRDVVDVLVGPETTMWAYGYDYRKIFQRVSAQPGISTDVLAGNIVGDYIEMHTKMHHEQYLAQTMLFANRLKVYDYISIELERTTEELCRRIEELRPEINHLRDTFYFKNVSRRAGICLLDLELWVKTIYKKKWLRYQDPEQLGSFDQMMRDMRVAQQIGAGIIAADKAGPGQFGTGGCSLFFPPAATLTAAGKFGYCEYFSGWRTSPFQQASAWDDFLKLLNA